MIAYRLIKLSILLSAVICFGCGKDDGGDGNSTSAAAPAQETQSERHASPGEAGLATALDLGGLGSLATDELVHRGARSGADDRSDEVEPQQAQVSRGQGRTE